MPFYRALLLNAEVPAVADPADNGMLFACWAIVIVLLAMAFAFLRSGKREYALAILPLLFTPFVHIISGALSSWLNPLLPLSAVELRVLLDLTSGLVSCSLLGVFSRGLDGRRIRRMFVVLCSIFIIILTLVLVTNSLIEARI